MKWQKPAVDRRKIIEFFIYTVNKIESRVHSGKINFNKLEEGVHEFRRNIRWLSIYAHSLDGFVILDQKEELNSNWSVYFSDKVIKSPFNVLKEMRPKKIR